MNVPGSVVIRHESAEVAQEQKRPSKSDGRTLQSLVDTASDSISSQSDSEQSTSMSAESTFKPPESYRIPASSSFPQASGPAVCVVQQVPQSFSNHQAPHTLSDSQHNFADRIDQEQFVRSVDLVGVGGLQTIQMPITVSSAASVPVMMESHQVSAPSAVVTVNPASFQKQTVQVIDVDIHICGGCKLQFNNVGHFIHHKQQGCQILRPVSQQEVVARSSVQQQSVISHQEQVSLPEHAPVETTSNVTVISEMSESQACQVDATQIGDDPMPSGSRVDVNVNQAQEIIQTERMEEEIERLLEESQTAKNLPLPKRIGSRLAPVKSSCHFADCTYMTAYQKDLERHWRIHTGERPYHCEHCERSFTRLDHLKLHRYSHTGAKPYQCPQCIYSTAEKSSLKKHIRIHTGEKPYKCQMCPYASRNSSQLIVHLRSHTGDAPFQCHICPSKFKINSDLKRHLRTHTGEKPFSCDMCDYKCAVKGNLQIHVKINHSGDNQYKCETQDCDFVSCSQKALREHQKIHLAEKQIFQCGECQYLCSSKASLRNHMATHSEERPFKCGYCTHSSKQRGNMKNHLMRKHPEQLPLRKRKKEKVSTAKKSPHKSRPMCKTSFDCSVCGDGFVREDSYKSHMKQHKELAIVMEDTALAVLQLQTPVTNIVRASAASGGETQEATVSSSSEAELRGEGVQNMRQFVQEGSDGPIVEVSRGKASVGGASQMSNRPEYVAMESSFVQGNVPTVIIESSSGKQIVVQVSGAPSVMLQGGPAQGVMVPETGPQSQMVPGSAAQTFAVPSNASFTHTVTVPAGGNPNYATEGAPQTSNQDNITTMQNVTESSFYTTAAYPSARVEPVHQVGQIQSVYSNTTTTAVASLSNVPQQMSTATVSCGQSLLRSTVPPRQASNTVQVQQYTSPSAFVSNVPLQGRRVKRRTMSTNSAIKITHTPLKKTKKQTVRSILSPSSQASAATISHQPVMQLPGSNPQVMYRSLTGIVSDDNGPTVASHSLPEHRVVVQVPVGENQVVDASGRPVFIQTLANSDGHLFGPSASHNQMIQVPPGAIQGSDSRVDVDQPVVMHVPVSVDDPSIPMQVAPSGQAQMMLAMPPGSESGICYRLVPQVAAPDGSITYSLLPQPYMPRDNQAVTSSPVTSQPVSQVHAVTPQVQTYVESSEVANQPNNSDNQVETRPHDQAE